MTKSPMLWGAGLACALGAAVAGNALGSTPVVDRPTIGFYYQTHDAAPYPVGASSAPLPDHYPLVTRSGIVPVAELGTRGLYSQARYRPDSYAVNDGPAGYAPPGGNPEASSPDYEFGDSSPTRNDGATPGRQATASAETGPAAPLQLASGPASVSSGKARMIDVNATLAMR